jgi:PIN domain nuclease of toxin-antitoxin system
VRVLLDTQIYLWFLADSPKLKARARTAIQAADEVYVSAASIWEAAIKVSTGKLEVAAAHLQAGIDASGFVELPVRAIHAVAVASLPKHHRDPFDRMLIAQAMQEPLALFTADPLLSRYSELVQVI